MNNYTWNQAPSDVPNMSNGGLPAQLYDVNLPTANVSVPDHRPVDFLHYSAHDTETGSHSNGATRFAPEPTPRVPPVWHVVVKGAFKGLFKRSTTNVATGTVNPATPTAPGAPATAGQSGGMATNLTGGITRANSR